MRGHKAKVKIRTVRVSSMHTGTMEASISWELAWECPLSVHFTGQKTCEASLNTQKLSTMTKRDKC